ncbi:uncharacterized protein LOC112888957 isoform X2 [Panicum hallii]|uniref:uncharacterized protein LOC112888957 isoform X2 n=1 Tax=Panicum hallii TaxID=206008 RepID=UPI000DF4DABA|nr:uncharacterized protein LOC112888957 isoform X2 [Panicum hallii]
MHQNKIPSLRSSGIYKWTSLSECHHTICATERTPQVPVSEGTITGRRRMEGKRVAAAAVWCMLVMLSVSGQQRVAGFRGFCGCFGSCYPGCREGNPAWLCTIKCVESCTVPIAAFGAGDCSKICLASICGAAETGDGKRDN